MRNIIKLFIGIKFNWVTKFYNNYEIIKSTLNISVYSIIQYFITHQNYKKTDNILFNTNKNYKNCPIVK